MKKATVNVLLVLGLVTIFVVSFVIGGWYTDDEERFVGTDSAATAAIEESNPDFEPWFQPFFAPESGEVESGLFALQAALGGTVLGFAFGVLYGRRHSGQAGQAGQAEATPVGSDPATSG